MTPLIGPADGDADGDADANFELWEIFRPLVISASVVQLADDIQIPLTIRHSSFLGGNSRSRGLGIKAGRIYLHSFIFCYRRLVNGVHKRKVST